MAQIVQESNAGGRLGAQFGGGLASGLQILAQNKLQQLAQRQQQTQQARGLSALEGLTPEMAQNLALLDPQTLGTALKGIQEQNFAKNWLQQQISSGTQGLVPGQENALPMVPGLPAPRNSREALEIAKIAATERKEQAKQQREIDKETLPVYQEISKEGKVASHNDKILNRVEQIVTKGNLGSPLLNSAINTLAHGIFGIGLDLNSLKTADAQELEKLSIEFVKNAKDIFGSRLTDLDLKTYLKGLPNLSQSREGMQRVIQNMRIANGAAKLRTAAQNEIIAENGGKRPRNLEELIEKRISPQLDNLASQFKIGELNKPNILGSESLGSLAQGLNLIY